VKLSPQLHISAEFKNKWSYTSSRVTCLRSVDRLIVFNGGNDEKRGQDRWSLRRDLNPIWYVPLAYIRFDRRRRDCIGNLGKRKRGCKVKLEVG
jgi:hypothetical protein